MSIKTAVVTGAGSGVGQAIAVKLARQGWRVALVGRRAESLHEAIKLSACPADQFLSCACDVKDREAIITMGRKVLDSFKEIDVLVNSAGVNVPNRSLAKLSLEDYHEMIQTNLNGAYYCVQAFLPQMRARNSGTIINIVSDSAKQGNPKAGSGYVMSKSGLSGLTQCINAEERGNGIRACAIYPGDIDTPLLNKRPQPPDAAARSKMLTPDDVADCALLCINLPSRAIVEELLIRPP